MPLDTKRQASAFDADGSELEENRQLRKLLLDNAVKSNDRTASLRTEKPSGVTTTAIEVLVVLALAPLFWAFSLATHRGAEEHQDLY